MGRESRRVREVKPRAPKKEIKVWTTEEMRSAVLAKPKGKQEIIDIVLPESEGRTISAEALTEK